MSETELIPCPFCEPLKMTLIGRPKVMGYGNERTEPGVTHWHGFCMSCGAEGPKEVTLEAAAAAWNRRARDEAMKEAAKRIEGQLRKMAGERWAVLYEHDYFFREAADLVRSLVSDDKERGSADV